MAAGDRPLDHVLVRIKAWAWQGVIDSLVLGNTFIFLYIIENIPPKRL